MELYKSRSISECLGDGWTLMYTNIKRIAKSMWWPVLLTVVFATVSAPTMFTIQQHNATNQVTTTDAVISGVILVAIIAIMILFGAKLFKLLNEQTIRFCMARMLKITAVMIAFSLILGVPFAVVLFATTTVIAKGIVAPTIGIGLFALVSLLGIIAMYVAFAPMNYVGVKYMIEPEMTLKGIGNAYKQGWKSLGKIVGFSLISSLVVFIAQCVISLPGVIAMFAATLSLQGIAYGDPSGLPSTFLTIYGMTMGVSCFISCILMIWFTLSEYYLYASIESKYRS